MSYAENKSLTEYGELNSQHHTDRQAEMEAGQRQNEMDKLPAFLTSRLLMGGSYIVEWSKGDAEVPSECQGLWTGVSQAQKAIDLCMARLTAEAAAQEEMEARADAEAEASRQERGVTKEEDEAALAEEVAPPKKTARKKSA
jgi:hypothetical protein